MRAFGLTLILCAACGGSPFRGAHATPVKQAPRGTIVHSLNKVECRDSSGEATVIVPARIEVVRLSNGKLVLLERLPGYDVLVVTNAFEEGDERVFQASMEPSGAAHTLREYRIGRTGGVLRVSDQWNAKDLQDGRFRAEFSQLALTCVLAPDSQMQ